jgi:guanylate kinase
MGATRARSGVKGGESGRMLVISGPSGCGKSTICRRLIADPRVEFSVSATTRKQRPGEVDGRDYHFVDRAEFERRVARGEFLEWAEVHGNSYGTLRAPLAEALARGKVYLLEIDVQGARQLEDAGVEGIYVFVAPPSFEELRRRLVARGTDAPEAIERRLAKAREEYDQRERYDHVVVNDDLERALAEIRSLAGLDAPRADGSPAGGATPGSQGSPLSRGAR